MEYVDGNLSPDQFSNFEAKLDSSAPEVKKEIYKLIREFRLANQAILIQEKKKIKIPSPFLKKLINIEKRTFNSKTFSDKQVMDFTDGNADEKTKVAINTVLKFGNTTSKKLAKRIDEMKIANSAMLLSTRKKMEMPKDFSEKLKELEKSKKNNVVEFIARPRAYINYISSGAIAAAVAAFVFLFASPFQQNQNIAQGFFASLEKTRVNDKNYFSSPIMMQAALNLDKYSDNKPKTIMRGGKNFSSGPSTEEKKSDENEKRLNLETVNKDNQTSVKENTSDNLFSISVKPTLSSNEYNLRNRGVVSIGAKIKLKFKAPSAGSVNFIYTDALGKTSRIIKQKLYSSSEMFTREFDVTEPIGQETLQFIFESEKNKIEEGKSAAIISEFITYSVIKPKIAFENFEALDFEKKPFFGTADLQKSEKRTSLSKFSKDFLAVTSFGETFLKGSKKQKEKIWQNDNSVFIDLTGDGLSNIIVTERNKREKSALDLIAHSEVIMLVDRNGNQKMDALVEINNIKQDTLLLKWFLDENEDGVVDKVAYDDNGDFKVDIVHSL